MRQIRKYNPITASVTKWGRVHFRPFPWRDAPNLWLAAAAEVMLQRTRASSVISVWLEFARKYPNPQDVTEGSSKEFSNLLAPLGLEWRARKLGELAMKLVETAGFPQDEKSILRLPGIGSYSSAALLSMHMGKRAVIIDANVVRLLCRLTGSEYDGETRRKRWVRELADALTPSTTFRDYNYGILDLSMTVCTKLPQCNECPLESYCSYACNKTAAGDDRSPG